MTMRLLLDNKQLNFESAFCSLGPSHLAAQSKQIYKKFEIIFAMSLWKLRSSVLKQIWALKNKIERVTITIQGVALLICYIFLTWVTDKLTHLSPVWYWFIWRWKDGTAKRRLTEKTYVLLTLASINKLWIG